ncbi:MAG: hypothetical protein GXP22_11310 [Gammaproteobacteria bacterium]|nr:hypothetical protein [Gammaproteobacteria bacterium]
MKTITYILLSALLATSTLLQAAQKKPDYGGAFTAGFNKIENKASPKEKSEIQPESEDKSTSNNNTITTLPDSYPESFQRIGYIDSIHDQDRTISLNDASYQIASIIPIHTLKGDSIPLSMLKPYIQIGVSLIAKENIITEIWILPDNYGISSE